MIFSTVEMDYGKTGLIKKFLRLQNFEIIEILYFLNATYNWRSYTKNFTIEDSH
jgi:hypothetical protein